MLIFRLRKSADDSTGVLSSQSTQSGFKDLERDWSDLFHWIDVLGRGAYLFTVPDRLRRLWRSNRNRMLCRELRVANRREADALLAAFDV